MFKILKEIYMNMNAAAYFEVTSIVSFSFVLA